MTATLPAAEAERLETALRVLLTPLQHDTLDGWAGAVLSAVRGLLGAGQAVMMVPAAGRPLLSNDWSPEAVTAYRDHFGARDPVIGRMQRLRLPVAHRLMAIDAEAFYGSDYYRDFCVPHRLHDTVGMTVHAPDGGPPVAWATFAHERPQDGASVERSLALLSLLHPAFDAGVHAWLAAARQREGLRALLDGTEQPVLLCAPSGEVLHEGAALGRLLAPDAEREAVRAEMRALAHAVAPALRARGADAANAPPPVREVRTAAGAYRLRASHVGEALLGRGSAVLVHAEAAASRALTDDELRVRFGLTAREVGIARLLGEGRSNAEIARQLFISPYTARNHTEKVLQKLGVARRARVGAVLRGGGA